MNYTVCSNEKEILNTVWNVYASFGYTEARFDKSSLTDTKNVLRLFSDDGSSCCSAALFGADSAKGMAEAAASAVEAALAVGFPDFTLEVKTDSEEVKELLYLYSLDEYISFSGGSFSMCLESGRNTIMEGSFEGGAIVCTYDLSAAAEAMKDAPLAAAPSKTVIYAEKNAEGIAYEISYTLRLMGCMAEGDISSESIEECEKYAAKSGASDLLRVFADGKLQIKSFADGEITETDYETFVGYYADEQSDECGCGEHHHHDHDGGCDCGEHHHDHDDCCTEHHHHDHDDGCTCGHCS